MKKAFVAAQGGIERAREGLKTGEVMSTDTSLSAAELLFVSSDNIVLTAHTNRHLVQSIFIDFRDTLYLAQLS